MRVVIDTSVWISALISPEGCARNVLRQALLKKIEPQMGTTLFLEYEAVMKRNRIRELCPIGEEERQELFNAYLSVCNWNEIYYLWRPNLPDADDDFLIELAVASNSELIITENLKDLKGGELDFNLEILTPTQYCRRYGS